MIKNKDKKDVEYKNIKNHILKFKTIKYIYLIHTPNNFFLVFSLKLQCIYQEQLNIKKKISDQVLILKYKKAFLIRLVSVN